VKFIPENNVMRFGDEKLIKFVNEVVPFEKYALPQINKHINYVNDGKESAVVTFSGRTVYANEKNKSDIKQEVAIIMNHYIKEVKENKCKPNDFLIVTPFVKHNPLVEALHLEIREFWKNEYNTDEYKKYSVFHKSAEGTSVDLTESEHSTRIVSIHTSKGDGRNIVFVIGLTESGLIKYSQDSNNLIYDSLLHVALTRMKKKLYIRVEYNNDDVCRRLDKTIAIKFIEPRVELSCDLQLDKIISYDNDNNTKYFDVCYHLIIKNNSEIQKIKRADDKDLSDSEENKKILDMKHHCIRYATMYILFLLSVADDVINKKINKVWGQSLYPILQTCIHCDVVKYENAKCYNMALFNKNKKDEIPILLYDGGEHHKNCVKLLQLIEINKQKLEMLLFENSRLKQVKFDVLEGICLFHMIEVSQRGQKGAMPIADMYDIIDLHVKSSDEEISLYTKYHYEKMNKTNKLYMSIDKKYPKLKWLHDKHETFKGHTMCINIHVRYNFIAYNETNVIICRICPQFNTMNYDKIIFESIFDVFVLNNCANNNNYLGKKIIMCIATLDMDEPFYIDFTDYLDINRKHILCIMKNKLALMYSVKNKSLYSFYKYYYEKYNIQSLSDRITKIQKERKKDFPDYVLKFFMFMDFSMLDKNEHEKQLFLEEFVEEKYFMEKINSLMHKSLNTFFGITDKDMEDFDNIQISDDTLVTDLEMDNFVIDSIDNVVKNITDATRIKYYKNIIKQIKKIKHHDENDAELNYFNTKYAHANLTNDYKNVHDKTIKTV